MERDLARMRFIISDLISAFFWDCFVDPGKIFKDLLVQPQIILKPKLQNYISLMEFSIIINQYNSIGVSCQRRKRLSHSVTLYQEEAHSIARISFYPLYETVT